MAKIKKWIPFFIILGVAFATFLNMVLFTEDHYSPQSDDPQIIYYEACASCHSDDGNGRMIIYPSIISKNLDREVIKKKITEGGWMMPRFNNIKADTLKKLVEYIYKGDFAN